MPIKITDDKKEKHQSFEASFSVDGTGWNLDLSGYGANEQEARDELCRITAKAKAEIEGCFAELSNALQSRTPE